MARELEFAMDAPEAREEARPEDEGGGRTVEIAIVTGVRRHGKGGLTVTKRNLTFKDGVLVDQGRDYQVRINGPSPSG